MSFLPTPSYISELVRRNDRDRFITALFAPSKLRARLLTLYAFNAEIARIREDVRDPMAGLLRLQWWRDILLRLERGQSLPKGLPIAESFGEVVIHSSLSIPLLLAVVDAREQDMSDETLETLDDLVEYCRQTSSNLSLLGLQCLDVKDEVTMLASEEVGLGWALTGTIRAIRHHVQVGRNVLPLQLLTKFGLTIHDLDSPASAAQVKEVIRIIGSEAGKALEKARLVSGQVDFRGLPILLPAILATQYLRSIKRMDYNPYNVSMERLRPGIPNLLFQAWRKKY